MKTGQIYNYLKDDQDPLVSPNTHAVAALITCDGKLVEEGGYINAVEAEKGKNRRTVVWIAEEKKICFEAFAGEEMTTAEFLRRWNDREWLAANLDHPITFLRTYQDKVNKLRDIIRENPPSIKITRGNGSTSYISTTRGPDGKIVPTEKGRKMLQML